MIHAELREQCMHVHIRGPLTIYQAIDFKPQLLAALKGAHEAEIDLADVSEIDSAGLQLLLLASREAQIAGHRLTLVGFSDACKTIIETLGLSDYFQSVGSDTQNGVLQ